MPEDAEERAFFFFLPKFQTGIGRRRALASPRLSRSLHLIRVNDDSLIMRMPFVRCSAPPFFAALALCTDDASRGGGWAIVIFSFGLSEHFRFKKKGKEKETSLRPGTYKSPPNLFGSHPEPSIPSIVMLSAECCVPCGCSPCVLLGLHSLLPCGARFCRPMRRL